MSTIEVSARGAVSAPAAVVYGWLADYAQHHHQFLPDAFSDYNVEVGGVGTGTLVAFTVTAGGRSRPYKMAVTEPEPGRVLREADTGSSLVTTFTVTPEGSGSTVGITTTWTGAGGIGGFFERRFAPGAMKKIYEDELRRIEAYAQAQAA